MTGKWQRHLFPSSSLAMSLIKDIIVQEANDRCLCYNLLISELLFSQDPVLFSGTFRLNLDPFNNYSDQELWNVVEVAQLKTLITAHDKGLHLPILEGGENMR